MLAIRLLRQPVVIDQERRRVDKTRPEFSRYPAFADEKRPLAAGKDQNIFSRELPIALMDIDAKILRNISVKCLIQIPYTRYNAKTVVISVPKSNIYKAQPNDNLVLPHFTFPTTSYISNNPPNLPFSHTFQLKPPHPFHPPLLQNLQLPRLSLHFLS